MMHRARALLAVLLCATLVTAQDDEADFNLKQADKLHGFAKKAFEKGFPRQARLIWLQLIKLYAPDHADAHKAIGNIKVGSTWNPDPAFTYPTGDTGSGAEGQSLFKQYESLTRDLANGHRQQAERYAKAGRNDRALHHWQMVIRWQPEDRAAKAALEHREVGTVTGTALEQTLYERSKAIEKAVSEQAGADYPVQKSTDARCAPLDQAQVKYVTVSSEHFVLHGDPEEEQNLLDALRWAERTLRVCQVVFPWQSDLKGRSTEWAFFVAKDTYKQILKANAAKIPDLEWRLEHTATCGIGPVIVGATGSVRVLHDACVRNVAQAYAGFATAGFNEGIGHTFVGMMFNNNRLFSVDLKKQQGTAASEADREYTSPDFDVWKTLNLEMAWKLTGGVPARELPFCEAATFTNEQRIKAWSFCDYVMRRDPELLRQLDRLGAEMKAQKQLQPLEFEQRFDQQGEVKVGQLDKEWEDFWTEASPVLKAIQNNTPPLQAVSRGVEKWLEAFNEARKGAGMRPVTWSTNLSARCHDHAQYLKQNKGERGPDKEHRQLLELGGSHVGDLFAQMAVVETSAKIGGAKKLFQQWLDIPGYRDTLVHDYLLSVGIYTEGDILVMNVTSALGEPRVKAGYNFYPRQAKGIPTEVEVALLGPELEELLAKNGHAGKKVVGYPLTLHFGINVQGNRQTYACKVSARGKDVPGLLLMDGGKIRRTSAPGMVTFYPLDPLPHGDIDVVWTWDQDNGAQRVQTSFTTK